ncbi:hypothetical protein SAMD00019534_048250 [Acytostelium subglobosum LB1]|uniref:hypothetical protein n=1 Tax=Acytostelium subglobosum LB1 TaxID=1410327 RepID=UPI000644FC33|nr:hypothetical protein SAMD00019534_048250 [Acytostelium subglobosum LB1]GAM21650.1 hypothetical protein SAMD00019534_048250 [Acytostelium subglobosum LB1]|eukprot:XP_012755769.1 hypothetical protein SAMD00019534_048250 [Acytostelium subglobosum LB1]
MTTHAKQQLSILQQQMPEHSGTSAKHTIQVSYQKWGEIKRYCGIIHEFASDAPNHPITTALLTDLYNISRVLVDVVDSVFIDPRDSYEKYNNGYGSPMMNGLVLFDQQAHLSKKSVQVPPHAAAGYYFAAEYPPNMAYYNIQPTIQISQTTPIASPQIIPIGVQMSSAPSPLPNNNGGPASMQGTPQIRSQQQQQQQQQMMLQQQQQQQQQQLSSNPSSQPTTPPQLAVMGVSAAAPMVIQQQSAASSAMVVHNQPAAAKLSSSPPSSSMTSAPKTKTQIKPSSKGNFSGEVFFDDISQDKPRRRRRTVYSAKRNLKCEYCHVTETPEWRRGPNGDHTLCNACGLHYAKSLKKKNKDEKENEEREKKAKEEQEENERKMKELKEQRDKSLAEKDTRKHSIDFVIEAT